ncbi:MAG: Crp/Fnr family transcriptional regulator [Bdellovibrionia bacterium]
MNTHPHFLWKDLFNKGKRRLDLLRILKENVLFSTLSMRELKYLSNFVYERTYESEEQIFEQGDRGVGMYLIASGRVAIRTHNSQGDVLHTVLNEGSFLGELALVDPQHLRTAQAIPLERSVLIGFFKPDLEDIIQRNPAMGVKILFQLSTVLGKRLLETTQRITVLKERTSEQEKNAQAA